MSGPRHHHLRLEYGLPEGSGAFRPGQGAPFLFAINDEMILVASKDCFSSATLRLERVAAGFSRSNRTT